MLKLYDISRFQEWYIATNSLYKAAYLETNEPLHHFVPFSVSASPMSHYYLYNDVDGGLCGSVELARLAGPRLVEDEVLPRGTWIVKNSYFFLPEDHPFSRDSECYEPLIQGFYQHIFSKICTLSARDQLLFALTYHQHTHTDFVNFGDFALLKEWKERDWLENKNAIMGLLSLKDQIHDDFSPLARKNEKAMVNPILPFPLNSFPKDLRLNELKRWLTYISRLRKEHCSFSLPVKRPERRI